MESKVDDQITPDGVWHETLNSLRQQLRRHMDGDIAKQQREMGAGYRMSFGVALPHLQQIAKSLPQDSDLAQVMWQKEVREMKLLALMIYPTEKLTKEVALQWIAETKTQEVAEQLVMRQLRHAPFLLQLLEYLFLKMPARTKAEREGAEEAQPSPYALMIRYLLLGHAALQQKLPPEGLKQIEPTLLEDLASQDLLLLSTINNTLIRLAQVPELQASMRRLVTIAYEVTEEGLPGKRLAEHLMGELLG